MCFGSLNPLHVYVGLSLNFEFFNLRFLLTSTLCIGALNEMNQLKVRSDCLVRMSQKQCKQHHPA